jgi:hypothetical protein
MVWKFLHKLYSKLSALVQASSQKIVDYIKESVPQNYFKISRNVKPILGSHENEDIQLIFGKISNSLCLFVKCQICDCLFLCRFHYCLIVSFLIPREGM